MRRTSRKTGSMRGRPTKPSPDGIAGRDPRYSLSAKFEGDCRAWLGEQFESLRDELDFLTPSQWAERRRYLSPAQTALPGFYSFDVAPYLREILDCMSPHSSIREIDIMKGVQVCFTVGILENSIGYYIDHVKDAPLMLLTVDDGMAALRMDGHITPLIINSGLSHLIKSVDADNKRKTGAKGHRREWIGGGSLIVQGSRSAGKLRSSPIRVLLADEVDGYPGEVGRDGDPLTLALDRTAAYEATRKVVRGSTPLIMQTSRIYREFLRGDQRRFFVPCKHCGEFQDLRFQDHTEDGTLFGVLFDLDEAHDLVEGSVRYVCKFCGGAWRNEDKAAFLPAGEWRPTSRSEYPGRRSYHLSALYSPVGMQTWEALVRTWLRAWDPRASRPRDMRLFQQFYNNVLGWPFEERGESAKFEQVVGHRRMVYSAGQIPNKTARQECGGRIEVLTAAVDVHRERLDVQVVGWTRGQRLWSILWEQYEGPTDRIDSPAWARLRELIEGRIFLGDDGTRYQIPITLIDAGFNSDAVYLFADQYMRGVYPILGRDLPVKSAAVKEFAEFRSKLGAVAFNVTSTIYKDRLSNMLRREWTGEGRQPDWGVNFPQDYPEEFFRQLTREKRKEKINPRTGQRMGFEWYRPAGSANHAWDLLVYNTAALEITALDICKREIGLEFIDWPKFWDLVELHHLFCA